MARTKVRLHSLPRLKSAICMFPRGCEPSACLGLPLEALQGGPQRAVLESSQDG
jgi:hypothetical protein